MTVHQLLLEALENLVENDFKTLKWYLSTKVLDDCKPIPRSQLESAQRIDTVTKIIDCYSENTAVDICLHVLKKMNQNNCALELQNAYTEYKGSRTDSASRPTSGAPATAQIMAQTGGVVIAPTITGGDAGTWNVTISKK